MTEYESWLTTTHVAPRHGVTCSALLDGGNRKALILGVLHSDSIEDTKNRKR
jgi:hypothetical protein